MTYLELYKEAERKLEKNEITIGEYEEMIAPLRVEIPEREKGEWIPVSERLPELDGEYLITYLTQGVYSEEDILVVCISDYDHDNGFWKSRKGKVIAWQPLPKPYEEGGE